MFKINLYYLHVVLFEHLLTICIHVHCSSQIWIVCKMHVPILQKLKHFSLGNFNFIIRLCHVCSEYEHVNKVFIFCFTIRLYYCFEHLYLNIRNICIVDIYVMGMFHNMLALFKKLLSLSIAHLFFPLVEPIIYHGFY
jgi:hypothetical protein